MNVTTKAFICGGIVAGAGAATYREYNKYSMLHQRMKYQISEICSQQKLLRANTLIDKTHKITLANNQQSYDFEDSLFFEFFSSIDFYSSTLKRAENVENLANLKSGYSKNKIMLEKNIFHDLINSDLAEYQKEQIDGITINHLDRKGMYLDINWTTSMEMEVIASIKLKPSTLKKILQSRQRLLDDLPYSLQNYSKNGKEIHLNGVSDDVRSELTKKFAHHLNTTDSLKKFEEAKKIIEENDANDCSDQPDIKRIRKKCDDYKINRKYFETDWWLMVPNMDKEWVNTFSEDYERGAKSLAAQITKLKITAQMQFSLISDLVKANESIKY